MRDKPNKGGKTIFNAAALGAVGAAMCAVSLTPAHADGGFAQHTYSSSASSYNPDGTDTNASATGDVTVTGNGVDHASTVGASASTSSPDGGSTLGASVAVGHETHTTASGTVTQDSQSKATALNKNGNIIEKARNDTHTTVVINGQTYVVVDEVARAVSRTSTAGSSSAAAVNQNVMTNGNGYAVDGVNTHTSGR
jgi:hypothetical protein